MIFFHDFSYGVMSRQTASTNTAEPIGEPRLTKNITQACVPSPKSCGNELVSKISAKVLNPPPVTKSPGSQVASPNSSVPSVNAIVTNPNGK